MEKELAIYNKMEIKVNNNTIDYELKIEELINKFFNKIDKIETDKYTLDIWIPKTNNNRYIFDNDKSSEITFNCFSYNLNYEIVGGGGKKGGQQYYYIKIYVDMVQYKRNIKLNQLGIYYQNNVI